MRRPVTLVAVAVLLAGPTALAFFAGGYFDGPRLVAALVAWTLVLVAAVVSPRPLPRSWPGRMAVAGLALVCAWTGASIAWAPLSAPATDNVVRLLLYVAALVAAAGLLRRRAALRAVEPALALGALVVIGYGLAGRLLPGLLDFEASERAGGRLEQPITYWNAEGALAAMGFVLCARLAGDSSRPTFLRALGAAACAPLGAGVYLSLSRGAFAAAAVGLCVVLAAAPTRPQLHAAGLAVAAAVTAAVSSAAFPGFASLEGDLSQRETDGAAMLGILLAVMLAAALASAWFARHERQGGIASGTLGIAARLPAVAAALVALTLAGLIVGGLGEGGEAPEATGRDDPGRLASLGSRRFDYWRVGIEALAESPLEGLGAAGFRVAWLRERSVPERTLDVHSLPLEMLVELGIVGLAAFLLFVAGVGFAARRALSLGVPLAGAAGAAAAWGLHATLDWDWQLPAVTLPAIVIAGAFIAAGDGSAKPAADRAVSGVGARP